MTKAKNADLRRLVRAAIDSGDYGSIVELARTAGINDTVLHPLMRSSKHGTSPAIANKIYPLVEKYRVPRDERMKKANKPNGHSNGGLLKLPPKGRSNAHITIARSVLEELFELDEVSTDQSSVRVRIDELACNLIAQGLEVIAGAAKLRQ